MGPRAGRSCGKKENALYVQELESLISWPSKQFGKLCIVSVILIESLTWNFDSLIL